MKLEVGEWYRVRRYGSRRTTKIAVVALRQDLIPGKTVVQWYDPRNASMTTHYDVLDTLTVVGVV